MTHSDLTDLFLRGKYRMIRRSHGPLRQPPNSAGYFLQNRFGATIAGPFEHYMEVYVAAAREEGDEALAQEQTDIMRKMIST